MLTRYSSYEEHKKDGFIYVKKCREGKRKDISLSMPSDFFCEKVNIGDCQVYYIRPNKGFNGHYIFYVYDSGYFFEPDENELKFILDISKSTGYGFFVPTYPLAPKNRYDDMIPMLRRAYKDYCQSSVNEGNFIVVGSGTGAGLLLLLASTNWKFGLENPKKLILLSPVLDKDFIPVDEFGDYSDICDDITIITDDDPDFCERDCRAFYEQNTNDIKMFRYEAVKHGFIYENNKKSRHARKILEDIITGSKKNIINEYMTEVWIRGDISRDYPDIFYDSGAIKYVSGSKNHRNRKQKVSKGEELLLAADYKAFDEAVKKFYLQYPNGTVIYMGSSLDTMYERVHNERGFWYDLDNCDKIAIRKMYKGYAEKEKYLEGSFTDDRWMDKVDFTPGTGIMIVCRNTFPYHKASEVKDILNRLYEKFPGANVVFDIDSQTAVFSKNFHDPAGEHRLNNRRYFVNSAEREVVSWNPVFSVISVKSILEDVKGKESWNKRIRMSLWLNNRTRKYKIVHIRLGYEKYGYED